MVARPLPRYVIEKPLADGRTGYYFNLPRYYRKLGCPNLSQPLGDNYIDACGADGLGGRAEALNQRLDEWEQSRRGAPLESSARSGTVDWLFRVYKASPAYLQKVAPRSRSDYERTMLLVSNIVTKRGDRIGDRDIRAITPVSADLLYQRIIVGAKGERLRQGEKAVKLCSKAWRVVHRLHPREFNRDVPDPWAGVALKRRAKKAKPAATREEVYAFAWGCIERGRPEPAAAAVICFEWLQRPENVLAGKIRWSDYRSERHPTQIRIEHHKTGKFVLHPLEEQSPTGTVRFYEEAEAVLAKLPQRGIPMILREVRPAKRNPDQRVVFKPFSFSGFEKIVQTMRQEIGLPSTFTLDACRHGGMTELEEAELTDGQGRALSAHSSKAYDGYAKRTEKRALAATRKRHAHLVAKNKTVSVLAEVDIPIETLGNGLGYIYFVECAGFVKIGFTECIQIRLASIQTGAPEKLRLLRYEVGSIEAEYDYHRRFSSLRSSGEWFRIEGALLELLTDQDKTKTEFLNKRAEFFRTKN